MAELKFEDLECMSNSYRAEIKKSDKGSKVIIPRKGIVCKLGDLTEEEWIKKVERLITEADEWELQRQLVDWVKTYPWIRERDKEIARLEALKHHAMRIFDNVLWVGFVEFNRKYRPEVLKNADLVWVTNDCCGKAGLITRARFDKYICRDGERINCCPICGKWSKFHEVHPDAEIVEKDGVEALEREGIDLNFSFEE